MNIMYAKIINKGECLSSFNQNEHFKNKWKDNNIRDKAGKNEWIKYDFYPTDELVGKIIDVIYNDVWNFNVYVLEISENIFVPISEQGIKSISEYEFINSKSSFSNLKKEANIDDFERFLTPDFTSLFIKDLRTNFMKLSYDNTKGINISIILEEIAMYSCEMIIQFRRQSGSINYPNILEIIVFQVHNSVSKIYTKFPLTYYNQSLDYVKFLIQDSNIETSVRDYYKNVAFSYNLVKATKGN